MRSERGKRFKEVVTKALEHIEDYTVPRYGDYPEDRLSGMSVVDCNEDMKKYTCRIRAPERYVGERAEDMLKIMHLASEAYLKIIDIDDNKE